MVTKLEDGRKIAQELTVIINGYHDLHDPLTNIIKDIEIYLYDYDVSPTGTRLNGKYEFTKDDVTIDVNIVNKKIVDIIVHTYYWATSGKVVEKW